MGRGAGARDFIYLNFCQAFANRFSEFWSKSLEAYEIRLNCFLFQLKFCIDFVANQSSLPPNISESQIGISVTQ